MNLSDEQKQAIARQLEDGASIADIQRLLTDEFKVSITYMETRFLLDDLNLELQDTTPEPEPVAEEEATSLPEEAEEDSIPFQPEAMDEGLGSVSVEIDTVQTPGMAISGTVTFSDGVSAKWFVDTMGRMGLDPEQEGYQPSPEDIQTFQIELQKQMQGPGF